MAWMTTGYNIVCTLYIVGHCRQLVLGKSDKPRDRLHIPGFRAKLYTNGMHTPYPVICIRQPVRCLSVGDKAKQELRLKRIKYFT